MEWVLSLEEEERQREHMKVLSWLPLPFLFMAPNTWYGRTVGAHPACTRCSHLRTKAVDAVRPDGTDLSSRTAYSMFSENLEFSSSNRYGRMVRSGLPVRMVTKVTDGFDKISNFSSSKLRMRYGRIVRAAPSVPMVVKVTVTSEHQKILAIFPCPCASTLPRK
jgi:hypothetical protein